LRPENYQKQVKIRITVRKVIELVVFELNSENYQKHGKNFLSFYNSNSTKLPDHIKCENPCISFFFNTQIFITCTFQCKIKHNNYQEHTTLNQLCFLHIRTHSDSNFISDKSNILINPESKLTNLHKIQLFKHFKN
jgi:hypothetical protein